MLTYVKYDCCFCWRFGSLRSSKLSSRKPSDWSMFNNFVNKLSFLLGNGFGTRIHGLSVDIQNFGSLLTNELYNQWTIESMGSCLTNEQKWRRWSILNQWTITNPLARWSPELHLWRVESCGEHDRPLASEFHHVRKTHRFVVLVRYVCISGW